MAVGEFRTSDSEENMRMCISTQWLRGGFKYLVTNKWLTRRQERREVVKRKEKLATRSPSGGDKAQELAQLKRAGAGAVSSLV